jgi:hypothetical protein
MNRVGRALCCRGLLFVLLLAPLRPAHAQGNFEIQVYGSETVAPRSTMIELHSNVAVRGTTRTEDRVRPTQGAFHETLEVTQGWTPWFETGFYLFTSIQPDGGWEWVGDHVRPRVRAPESWQLPVGLSLSLEVGYQRREFSTDTWTLELRPIIDKKVGGWYASLNPVFGRSLAGAGVKKGRGFEFSPNAKIAYDVTSKVGAGLEYYGGIGPVNAVDPLRQQQHLLFAVVDLDLGPRWEFNAGVGFGLTPATDGLLIKMILGYRFDWGSGGQSR